MSESIDSRVKDIVAKNLDVEKDKINNTSSFINDFGADSLDRVELVMAFEEVFGCEISDEDAEKILTVQNAIDYITKNSENK